ncbi:MAG: peptidoglycan-associated lipoprotein Pal [Syntrophales bacterium]|nr:peptidoglycan-associated lipoprotein Pal [Syntrophales bacterium]HOG07124.1 peptidoglycan-associated lipoprotein Pal [Syntrophales bacterium]HOS77759.1 peptidoglycan-associated lipoprotein Pal [Syntrophales bacterium]HPB70022.1 peptidoglycan-associated lipoprotein Pal [Syntrophales bacterium]HQN25807.1 peptidoglycan-associated lipoprotein Pal [Syntrophales bacterium]
MIHNRTRMKVLVCLFCFAMMVVLGCATTSSQKEVLVEGEDAVAAEQTGAAAEAVKPGEPEPIIDETLAEPDAAAPQMAADEVPPVPVAKPASTVSAASEAPAWENIQFDYDKFSLNPEARVLLDKLGEWLLRNKGYAVVIEGHCDERGTTEYNLALGERRAMEAKAYLTGLGVAAARIKTISYGKEMPLDPGHDEEAWAKNRRDQFLVELPR